MKVLSVICKLFLSDCFVTFSRPNLDIIVILDFKALFADTGLLDFQLRVTLLQFQCDLSKNFCKESTFLFFTSTLLQKQVSGSCITVLGSFSLTS